MKKFSIDESFDKVIEDCEKEHIKRVSDNLNNLYQWFTWFVIFVICCGMAAIISYFILMMWDPESLQFQTLESILKQMMSYCGFATLTNFLGGVLYSRLRKH